MRRLELLSPCRGGVACALTLAASVWASAAPAAPRWAGASLDASTPSSAREKRAAWMLSVEGVTHAPLDLGFQGGFESPTGLRLFAGFGWVPQAYSKFLTGVAASASADPQAKLLLERATYGGNTFRVQAGVRPFRRLGFYGDVGYTRLSVDGALDLSDSGIPTLQGLGGGYHAHAAVDLWLIELGYQSQIEQRFVWAVALGVLGTFDARTRIVSVNGAPGSAALVEIAQRSDAALKSYGFVPTLTLRLGFDLI